VRLVAIVCAVSLGLAAGPVRWTERQAESIDVVRGLRVHVRRCTGLGVPRPLGRTKTYARFACLAGARAPHQTFDTVAVTYVLRPLGRYAGRSSRVALANVRFEALQVP
jgi:hypothetical protein